MKNYNDQNGFTRREVLEAGLKLAGRIAVVTSPITISSTSIARDYDVDNNNVDWAQFHIILFWAYVHGYIDIENKLIHATRMSSPGIIQKCEMNKHGISAKTLKSPGSYGAYTFKDGILEAQGQRGPVGIIQKCEMNKHV